MKQWCLDKALDVMLLEGEWIMKVAAKAENNSRSLCFGIRVLNS